METQKLSEKEFGELFSTSYDEVGDDVASQENDMPEFLQTLAFSLVLTIEEKTGIKVREKDILHHLMICSFDETPRDKERFSAALFQRLKYLNVFQSDPDIDSSADK